jgi:signal peptidase I
MSDGGSAVKCELAAEVLRSFGALRFAATGWSMLPSVWPGDTLVVESVSHDHIHIGDVVLVGREGRLCAHRVVSKAGSGNPHWVTQGDAMPAPDRPVNENELLGRVAYLIRAGKLIAVPKELNVVERLTSKIVRRSLPAARALVYLHRVVRTLEKSAPEKSVPEKSVLEKSVLPCQG